MKYSLPELTYKFTDLEPYIDGKTMEIHYGKHHRTYVDKLNLVLDKYPKLADRKLEDLLLKLNALDMDEKDRSMLRNNAGGHLNHTLYWSVMGKVKSPDLKLIDRITKKFGSVDEFKKLLSETALNHFGSGWAWLVDDDKKDLAVYSTPNQDSPYLHGHTPIIGLDVWEHAYYLKYQNRRVEYIENWWNVLKLV
jgi:superoxide dismutase, Fe-Mn family